MSTSRSVVNTCAVLALALAATPLRAEPPEPITAIPEYQASDSQAALVTPENLLSSERFWPYHVALRRPWQPAGQPEPLAPGINGVLIRVEAEGRARIDFGRDGLHEVPIAETDLVDRANRIRSGAEQKMAPNSLLALGSKLVDSASSSPRPFPYAEAARRSAFLSIFVDPAAAALGELARALEPLKKEPELLIVLLPQGGHPDALVHERLRAEGFSVPFVYSHLASGYTRSLLYEGAALPALMLQTREGRVLFARRFDAEAVAKLRSALSEALLSAKGAPAQD